MTADLVPLYEEHTELELKSNWESQRCLESTQNGEKPFPVLLPQGLCPSGQSQVGFSGCRSIRNPSCVLPSLPARGEHLQGPAGSELSTHPKSLSAQLSQLDQAQNYRGPCSPDWFHPNHVRELLNSPVNTLVRMGKGRTHYPAHRV